MSVVGAILVMACLTILNYRFRRSVVYPPFVFCVVWLLDLFVFWLQPIPIDQLHSVTLNLVVFGAVLFTLGGWASFLVPASLFRRRFTIIGFPKGRGRILSWAIVAVLAIALCLQFRYVVSLAGGAAGLGPGLLAAARNSIIENLSENSESMRLFTYVTTWSIFVALLFRLEKRRGAFRVAVAIAFVSAVLSTGRGQILLLFAALSAIHLIRSHREGLGPALRVVRWPLIGFAVLFVVLMFSNKQTDNLQVSAAAYIAQSVAGYLCGSVAALDLVLRHPWVYVQGAALPSTLRTLFTIAGAMRLMPYTAPPAFEAYVSVPFPINTFTLYKSFYMDYGLYGAVLMMSVIGFFHSLLYRKARMNSELGLFMFAVSMYPLIMVFFVDAYTSFALYIHAFIFATAYMTLRSFRWGIFREAADDAVQRSQIGRVQ